MESHKLKILQVQDPERPKNVLARKIDPVLPDIAKNCCILIIGKVRASKSTIISNLMLNENFYKDLFDSVHIISPTASQDATSRFLVDKYEGNVHNEYSDDLIESILRRQKSFPKDERPLVMLVIDDCLGLIPQNSLLWHLSSRYRHYNICMIITTQAFKRVDPVLRVNASHVLVCWNLADIEIEKIAAEYGSLLGTDENFLSTYKRMVQKDPYTFLYLNMDNGEVHKNFTERIYSPMN